MSVKELKSALADTLEKKGVYAELRAKIRSEIFACLDEGDDVRPPVPDANLILNEVIREYLSFNGYGHTLSVFMSEARCGAEPL